MVTAIAGAGRFTVRPERKRLVTAGDCFVAGHCKGPGWPLSSRREQWIPRTFADPDDPARSGPRRIILDDRYFFATLEPFAFIKSAGEADAHH